MIEDGSSISIKSARFRHPSDCNSFYDNYRPKSSRSTSHNSRHYRRHKRHRYRDFDELRPMTPSRVFHHSGHGQRDYRNPMPPMYGPASLPPPSPLLHSPLSYSNRSHRRHRKKYVPYRNKNHHKHHYDRYRYLYPIRYDPTEIESNCHSRRPSGESGYHHRNKYDESRRRHVSGSSSFQSASTFVDKRTRNNSFCSSCDEVEPKSCHDSQCSCNFSYSGRVEAPIEGKIQNKILVNPKDYRENLPGNLTDSIPPLLPPKKSQR